MYSVDHGGLILLLHPDWVTMDIDKLGKSFYNSDEQPLSEPIRNLKAKTLDEALLRKNFEILISYLRSTEGLLNNDLRARIWPILLGIDNIEENLFHTNDIITGTESIDNPTDFVEVQSPASSLTASRELAKPSKLIGMKKKISATLLDDLNIVDAPPHRDEEQVKLDIQRSSTILSHIKVIDTRERDSNGKNSKNWGKGPKGKLKKQLKKKSSKKVTQFTNENNSDPCVGQLAVVGDGERTEAIDIPADPNTIKIEMLKKKLLNLIIKILRKYPALNYYQGYHDIASIILIVCYNRETKGIDEGLAFQILEKLTIFHLRDFMIKDINLSVNHLRLIPVLLESSDFEIFALIKSTNTAYLITEGELFDYKFYQGLSSVLTIFSHDLLNIQQLLTIWDFIFSYNSVLASIYVYTSTLMYFKDDIFKKLGLALDDEFQDFDKIDKDLVHTMLSPGNLFANIKDRDLIKILNKAEMLIEKFPLIDGELKVSDVEWDVDEKTKSGHLHISDESDKPEIDSFVVASDSIPEVQKVHVDPSWFEFNKHSVLFTSSTICSNLIDRNKANSKYQNLFNRDFLDEWIQTQDDEVSKQSLFEVQLQQEILDRQMQSQQQEQQELSTSTSDFSGSILLSSSLSSLSTVASSSALSTSVLIKKLLRVGRDDDNDDELNDTLDRKKAVSIYNASNIYKVSFTIGFIGFMAHFLLMRSNTRYFEVTRHIGGHIEELSSIGTGLIRDVSHGLSNAFRETTNGGILGHIGIGNIRNMIYGLH